MMALTDTISDTLISSASASSSSDAKLSIVRAVLVRDDRPVYATSQHTSSDLNAGSSRSTDSPHII